jgi:hypothetical protein
MAWADKAGILFDTKVIECLQLAFLSHILLLSVRSSDTRRHFIIMSDTFSISAGVVGVVSLGLAVTQGFLDYYGPWKAFDDEIQGFTTKIDGLLHTLEMPEAGVCLLE